MTIPIEITQIGVAASIIKSMNRYPKNNTAVPVLKKIRYLPVLEVIRPELIVAVIIPATIGSIKKPASVGLAP